jgi:hypothetical protein
MIGDLESEMEDTEESAKPEPPPAFAQTKPSMDEQAQRRGMVE